MKMKTKKEQYQKAESLYNIEYKHFADKYTPLIKDFKPIFKNGTLEEKITALWLWLENDRYFVEDTEEWTKIAKAIEREHKGAPVLEWCALYYVTLDWLYNIRNFIKVAKESLFKFSSHKKELEHLKRYKELGDKLVEVTKMILAISQLDNDTPQNAEDMTKILGEKLGKGTIALTKEKERISEIEKLLTEIEEDTTNLIGGIKSSGVAFTEYYESLGFANFMPSSFTDMIKELSSSYYEDLQAKFFYDKIKLYKPLTNKTTKKIQKNIKFFLDE